MDGYGRLQKVIALWKEGRLTREAALTRLLGEKGHRQGKLNKAAFNIAVEQGLCLVCWKWHRCIVRDCTVYTHKGMCTWFEAVQKGGE